MSQTNYIPAGYHTVTPYFVVPDARAFMKFVSDAFGAEEKYAMKGPDGTIPHAEMTIGDSIVMLGQASSQHPARQMMMHMYVPDADAVYKRALAAGAKSVREPADQFYGDRTAGVEDPFGNYWYVATHKEELTPEEVERRAASMRTSG